jgi:plastocyanin
MKTNKGNRKRAGAILCMTGLLLFVTSSWATTHIVQFGGNLGFVYSPSTFSAKIGDTVEWQGAFATHPLSSTTIPAKAASWHAASGTSFSYIITQPGTYNYHCDIHFSIGMVGSFQVASVGVRDRGLNSDVGVKSRMTATIVEGRGSPSIRLNAPRQTNVKISLFDAQGRNLVVAVDRMVQAGVSMIALGPRIKVSGFYIVKISGDGVDISRPLFLTKR